MNFDTVSNVKKIAGEADWVGLRYVEQQTTDRAIRDEKPETNYVNNEKGAMVEVLVDGQFAYAGTSDVSEAGLKKAAIRARELATAASQYKLVEFDTSVRQKVTGSYNSPQEISLDSMSVASINDLLIAASKTLNVSDKVVSRGAGCNIVRAKYAFASSNGSDVLQNFDMVGLNFRATAQDNGETQTRSERDGMYLQIGAEVFNRDHLLSRAETIGREAVELCNAEECPNETTTLVVDPGQMILQIHESIGHPLEIDRILGDERNYAGWSFIREKDFGTLQYGSELMNVTFDPTVEGEFASYQFDDSGTRAEREYLIKDGKLLRGLGGAESQFRSGLAGVANSRAQSWNRPPLDRMGNINLEPGESAMDEIIGDVERGVFMMTNRSWSIDDYRNKFQFGCEYAKLIENGKLTKTLKNPNYRAITTPFWNSLDKVGDRSTFGLYGTPYCGKAEPNQAIRVGHGSPVCRFRDIEVFGGQA